MTPLTSITSFVRGLWWQWRSERIAKRLCAPLQQYLQQYSLIDVLVTVYACMQHLQFEKELPPFLWHPILNEKHARLAGLTEWELDVLAREAIIHSRLDGGKPFGSWSNVAGGINRIKRIEEKIWGAYPHGQRDIILELHRIAHRQFPWQRPTNHPAIGRYFKVYGDNNVDKILHDKTGLTATDLFRVGLSLTGHFVNKPTLAIPIPMNLGVEPAIANKFLMRFATTIPSLQQRILERQSLGINWAYSSNALRDTPLIIGTINEAPHYVCPIPSFLLMRLTSGIYYELVSDKAFANAFGKSFQKYLGDMLARTKAVWAATYAFLPEQEYGSSTRRKDTVDWIVEDSSAVMFVEAKTKRLVVQAKIDLEARSKLEEELNKLADSVVQLYKTIRDALDGQYPHWQPSALRIYPMVVTLEEWFPQGPIVHRMLDNRVRQEMQRLNLDLTMLDAMPYSIASADDFEMAMQVIAQRSIDEVMAERTTKEKREWLLAAVLTNSYSENLDKAGMLFPEIWNEMLPGHDL